MILVRPLGIQCISSRRHSGAKPMPSMPTPISAATVLHSTRCWFVSSQVWWMFSSGAPDSSNCPPGSSVIEHRPFSSAIGLPFSSTGFQPKRVSPSIIARTLAFWPS